MLTIFVVNKKAWLQQLLRPYILVGRAWYGILLFQMNKTSYFVRNVVHYESSIEETNEGRNTDMCIVTFNQHQHPKYKLIIASNRDEFYERPTAQAHFWEDHPSILAG